MFSNQYYISFWTSSHDEVEPSDAEVSERLGLFFWLSAGWKCDLSFFGSLADRWCQTDWFEHFWFCWSPEIFTHNETRVFTHKGVKKNIYKWIKTTQSRWKHCIDERLEEIVWSGWCWVKGLDSTSGWHSLQLWKVHFLSCWPKKQKSEAVGHRLVNSR